MELLAKASRLLFFTGKGGVGKTSLACATAVRLADDGKRVLLVSTDPASNLDQVFGLTIGDHEPTAIPEVPRLHALNVDPGAAAAAYRDRLIGPVRNLLPPEAIRSMEEQLSGACTTEIAAFDEFTGLLTDPEVALNYDHLIFDTAPTGHTLRLLQLPSAWSGFLESSPNGTSCLGPLAGLEKQRHRYTEAVALLGNPASTQMVLVSRAQKAALREAARTSHELQAMGVCNQILILNGLLPQPTSGDPLAESIWQREQHAIAELPAELAGLPREAVWLQPFNLVGVAALRALLPRMSDAQADTAPSAKRPEAATGNWQLADGHRLSELIDELERDQHGLVMVLGKGGVGKTTVASAIAVELANRGHAVHLTTTDPAAHLVFTVDSNFRNLQVDRIDPVAESERYRREVLETNGRQLDEAGRALLAEDLRSPCTDEIAVFQAFSRILQEAQQKFVVVDTAPTGHTLLLLDATGAYHRDMTRHLAGGKSPITPLMRLQDPEQTKMVIVTLAEPTPVSEAELLQADLRRAGIEPWAWVINSALSAARPDDPLLLKRAEAERAQIQRVRANTGRLAIIPFLPFDPVGNRKLLNLSHSQSPPQTSKENG